MNRRNPRKGFSLVELLIVIAIILIIGAIAVPKLNRTRMYSQEMAAIRHVHAVHTAQTQYYSQFGKYAQNLTELGPPPSGGPSPAAADLLPSDLSGGTKGGYTFQVQGGPAGYTVNANPVAYNSSGSRSFFSDQTLVIREHYGPEPATVNSKEIK